MAQPWAPPPPKKKNGKRMVLGSQGQRFDCCVFMLSINVLSLPLVFFLRMFLGAFCHKVSRPAFFVIFLLFSALSVPLSFFFV